MPSSASPNSPTYNPTDSPTLFGSLLDMILPPVCPLCEDEVKDGPLCRSCISGFSGLKIASPMCTVCGAPFAELSGDDHPCGECLTKAPPFTAARSAFAYDGIALIAIHDFKYNGKVILAPALGTLASLSAVFPYKPDIAVPVPLHGERLKKRGFNQSLLLARAIAERLSIDVDYLNLTRVRATGPQINLKAKERERNIAGAFAVNRPREFKGARVLLVDDVFTTGATIKECAKALKKTGAEVFALTLARALKV